MSSKPKVCGECERRDTSARVRDQGGGALCDHCFSVVNELNNLAGDNLRLEETLEYTKTELVAAQTQLGLMMDEHDALKLSAKKVVFFLDGHQRVERTPYSDDFLIPNKVVDGLIQDLIEEHPDLERSIKIEDLETELRLAAKQYDSLEQWVRDISNLMPGVHHVIRMGEREISAIGEIAQELMASYPEQRCEVNICEPDDPACHCNFLSRCAEQRFTLELMQERMKTSQAVLTGLIEKFEERS